MDYLQFATTTVRKYEVEEVDGTFLSTIPQGCVGSCVALYWATQIDPVTGEIVADTEEVMLEFADGKFAYTNNKSAVEAPLEEALKQMLASMSEF